MSEYFARATLSLVPLTALLITVGCTTPNASRVLGATTLSTSVTTTVTSTTPLTTTTARLTPSTPSTPSTPTTTRKSGAKPGTFEAEWKPSVEGLLTFRGNPNRNFYGIGPVPGVDGSGDPAVVWTYPKNSNMCRQSSAKGETKTWCGAGWTGQPTVHVRNGRTWLVFNGYDGAVHFVDADTGEDILPPFQTGDIIKGTVTIDPDGYPIVYSGSRDNYFRAIAIDRPDKAVELWRLSANDVSPPLWNNDWDGSALVLDDYLLEGGENSQFHIVKLNRTYDSDGNVAVDPVLVFNTPGWDDQLLRDLAGQSATEVSIENSIAVDGDVVYFGNSGGLIQGWNIGPLRTGGTPQRVFRFWMGDDTDASVVIDDEGFLYVGAEYERGNARSKTIGQLVKLDPRIPDNPVVWSVKDQGSRPAGIWSTVGISKGVVVATTNGGRVLGLDQTDGTVLWEFRLPAPLWQSPVIVDDVLIQGDCNGDLHAYDFANPRLLPVEIWSLKLGGCIEATPAVWKGAIYLATRGGKFFAIK